MTYLLAGGRRVRAHPAADVFPLLSKDEITALAADIRTYGQRLPVLLQQADDGADLVLDGRNRLLACEVAGVEPRVDCVEPTADAVQVIVSTNLARRHQGESQRAMSAARLVNLRGRPEQIASIDAISQGSAAGLLHLGRATVQRAVAILHDPLLAPAVDAGTQPAKPSSPRRWGFRCWCPETRPSFRCGSPGPTTPRCLLIVLSLSFFVPLFSSSPSWLFVLVFLGPVPLGTAAPWRTTQRAPRPGPTLPPPGCSRR